MADLDVPRRADPGGAAGDLRAASPAVGHRAVVARRAVGGHAEFNAVDASLWFIVAVRDLVDAAEAGKTTLAGADRDRLLVAVTEITDAEAPFTPRGCPFQAWSVGELLRVRAMVAPADGRTAGGVTSAPPVETAAPSAS